jgi:hypothetical protein
MIKNAELLGSGSGKEDSSLCLRPFGLGAGFVALSQQRITYNKILRKLRMTKLG